MSMMEKLIAEFPNNIAEAIKIANNARINPSKREIQNIVICGMGGSGIGGSLVSKWVEKEINVPIVMVKDYSLPAFVDENSLVIGSSYSGNTEETISAINEAIVKNAMIIGITSGGKMQAICEENNFDEVIVPGGNPPRTALAFSIIQLINIFEKLDLIENGHLSHFENARKLIIQDEKEIKLIAMELAKFLKGKVGVLYGATEYEPVLVRARQQFNENGKLLCWHHAIPEMNHNELVGWGGGDDRFAVVFFDSAEMNPRNVKRFEISKERILGKTKNVLSIPSKGNNSIERSIYYTNIVDWSSLYLSDIKSVDPVDIEVIDYLKSELSKFK